MRLAAALALWPGAADAACRLALVLAMDVSASVDGRDYALQTGGLARALTAPEVREAFLAGDPVALAAFEWSGERGQRIVLPWTMITDAAALESAAARIGALSRPGGQGATAIGAAMLAAAALLGEAPVCAAQTVDISGDGANNAGPLPERVRDSALLEGITVNALAIGGDLPMDHGPRPAGEAALSGYFEARVIRGPGAFVEVADGFEDFERAMRRKLVRELGGLLVGALEPPRR